MSSTDPEPEGAADAEHQPPPSQEPAPLDIDAEFAAIVAAWGAPYPAAGTWPDLEGLKPAGNASEAGDGEPIGLSFGEARLAQAGPAEPADVEPERFVPPEPPPLPRGDALSRLSWAGVIGGPLFLLIAAIAWHGAPQGLIIASIAGFVGGFIALVSRMPQHRDDDDDDGAVV